MKRLGKPEMGMANKKERNRERTKKTDRQRREQKT